MDLMKHPISGKKHLKEEINWSWSSIEASSTWSHESSALRHFVRLHAHGESLKEFSTNNRNNLRCCKTSN